MTEITKNSGQLSPAVEDFVLRWGDMGGQWGVNRSVAQIHALLYVSDKALTAEEIAETLDLARSNVSNSIKELLGWKLIHRVPVKGDRRDHFSAETDIWEMVRRIAEGRKEREIDPAAAALRSCVAAAESDKDTDTVALKRLREMLSFVETMSLWYSQMLSVPKPALVALIKMGAKVTKVIPANSKKERAKKA